MPFATVDVGLTLAALPVALASLYLLVLTLLAAPRRPPSAAAPHLRFTVVVPAHDEEAGIAATVRSLLATAYPATLRRVVVVADNCTDRTAVRAAAAGAEVLVRSDPLRRGKGYALAFAFERILATRWTDAVAVVDADCQASPNLLDAFAARLDAGAMAVQAANRVGNPHDSWRAALMAIAFTLVNVVRARGRERLGVSAGLHGTGMCFAANVLRRVPHAAFSLVEDLEYGLRLGLAGHRVHFAAEAWVSGDAPSTRAGGASQRRRWEDGRRQVARAQARTLLRRALETRDPILVDLWLDLVVPPLARLGLAAVLGGALSVILSAVAGRALTAVWPWGLSVAALGVHVGAGWGLSGTGLGGLAALLHAPAYLAWKLRLALTRTGHPPGTWVRTERGSPP
ncbi:MAG TPA: glycosyltransferase family 2 protein [Anaeromyxobacteraceae bacterium]|nr:glycosyltransferase family 2 protein [Anaeromyxobacteraceae bacterium]